MAEDKKADDVEKILSDEKMLEGRKQALIDDLLRQREEAIKVFDEKLAKLGYQTKNSTQRTKRSHHKAAPPPEGAAKPKA